MRDRDDTEELNSTDGITLSEAPDGWLATGLFHLGWDVEARATGGTKGEARAKCLAGFKELQNRMKEAMEREFAKELGK